MAGSFSHLVDYNGRLTFDLIDHLGDAKEAIEELYDIIYEFSGGDVGKISAICEKLRIVDPWDKERYDDEPMPLPMKPTKDHNQ